jgi:hypothetical protein
MGYISKNRASGSGFLSRPTVLEQLLADAAAGLDAVSPGTQCPAPIPDPFYVDLLHATDLAMLRAATAVAFNAGSPNPSSGSSGGDGGPQCNFKGGGEIHRRKFKCPQCTSTFSRKDNLKTHQRLHSGEMPFECSYCSRKFMWQSSARTHELTHQRAGRARRAHALTTSPRVKKPVSAVVPSMSAATATDYGAGQSDRNLALGEADGVWTERESSASSDIQESGATGSRAARSSGPSHGLGLDTSADQKPPKVENALGCPPMPLLAPSQSALRIHSRQPDSQPHSEFHAAGQDSVTSAPVPVTLLTNRSTGKRLAVPQLQLYSRGSVETSMQAASGPLFSLEELIDVDETGQDVGAQVPITPQGVAESPMFGASRISQHELEQYMEAVVVPEDEHIEEYRP